MLNLLQKQNKEKNLLHKWNKTHLVIGSFLSITDSIFLILF